MKKWTQIKKAVIKGEVSDISFTPITQSTPLIEFFHLHSQRKPTHGPLAYGQRCPKCEEEGMEFQKMGALWFPKDLLPDED